MKLLTAAVLCGISTPAFATNPWPNHTRPPHTRPPVTHPQPPSTEPDELVIYPLPGLGGRDSVARDINESNTIVGEAQTENGETHAFIYNPWWPDYGIRDIGTAKGGTFSAAYGISDEGTVVGVLNLPASGDTQSETRAFSWKDGKLTILPPLNGASDSVAEEVNDHGQIVGSSGGIATIWENGKPRGLGTLGGKISYATGINKKGWVSGTSETADGFLHAFVWYCTDGSNRTSTCPAVMIDLGTLGGNQSFGDDINELDQIIGNSETANGEIHAFVWEAGTMIDADFGIGSSTGNAWSRKGLGAGGANFGDGPLRACLWDWDGTVKDIGVLPGMDYSYAFGVNDGKVVVGYSFSKDPAKGLKSAFWKRVNH